MGERTERRRARGRRKATFSSVLGELLITAGVIVLLYDSWQLWIGDEIISGQQHAAAASVSQEWADAPISEPADDADPSAPAVVPAMDQPEHGDTFGVMYVPRFGSDWKFEIAGGVTRPDILDKGEIGHYPDTAMPGEVGNTVYAAHRWTSGAPFDPIDKLVIGDAIVIETKDGWFTYRYRSSEYVQDTQVEVLLPVPHEVGVEATASYITLTSCAPKLNMLERIIAYGVFESFTPRADGPPAALTEGEA